MKGLVQEFINILHFSKIKLIAAEEYVIIKKNSSFIKKVNGRETS
jgi:hypothetical protein